MRRLTGVDRDGIGLARGIVAGHVGPGHPGVRRSIDTAIGRSCIDNRRVRRIDGDRRRSARRGVGPRSSLVIAVPDTVVARGPDLAAVEGEILDYAGGGDRLPSHRTVVGYECPLATG